MSEENTIQWLQKPEKEDRRSAIDRLFDALNNKDEEATRKAIRSLVGKNYYDIERNDDESFLVLVAVACYVKQPEDVIHVELHFDGKMTQEIEKKIQHMMSEVRLNIPYWVDQPCKLTALMLTRVDIETKKERT